MSPSGPRICRDCANLEGERCMRVHEAGKIDLVTGQEKSGKFGFDAYYERNNESHLFGVGVSRNLCGPSGRFFEGISK